MVEKTRKDIEEFGINLEEIWDKELFGMKVDESKGSRKRKVNRPRAPGQRK